MSWGWTFREVEQSLEVNNIGKDAEERQKMTEEIFGILDEGLRSAMASRPEILFVTSAGNDDSDESEHLEIARRHMVATTTLSSQSDVLFRTAFSPVRAISKRHPREPTQHVRTTCARNPYVPRVLDDPCAYATKRRSLSDRVLPGRSAFGSAPVRSDATRVQQVHREPLPTKGFKRSRRLSSDASLRETGLNIGR